MKLNFVCLGVLVVSSLSLNVSAANQIVYGLENAQHFKARDNSPIYIQTASFTQKANAIQYQHLLQTKTRYPVRLVARSNAYSVVIGPIPSIAELRKTAVLLNHKKSNHQYLQTKQSVPTRTKVIKHKTRSRHHYYSKLPQDVPHLEPYKEPVSTQIQPVEVYKESLSKEPLSKEPVSMARWFLSVAGGADFTLGTQTQFVENGSGFPAPFNVDSYSASTPQQAGGLINITGGMRWEQDTPWLSAYSLGIMYQHNFNSNITGLVTQYSLPQFANYDYSFAVSSDLLLVTGKVNLNTYKQFSPYIMAGIGGAFNQTSYSETALAGVTARVSPNFSGNQSQFAYNAGLGLDFRICDELIINVGYLYQNLGGVQGQGQGTWADTTLGIGSLGVNEVLAGITYLF